jgi:glutamyl-tRNA synthetase
MEGLAWLKMEFDEVYRQSERTKVYKKHIEKMLAYNRAYVSKEPARDNSGREVEIVRLKNPNKTITFKDEIRGSITFDTAELGDFVIAKNINEPLYHLAVVIDDFEMGVTNVIRGEEHISNTPRQILIQEAIDAPRPKYAHIPLILAPDRSKLSKRYGAVAVTEYRNLGYLPEAMVNYLALLGWSPGTDQEIFTIEELIAKFTLNNIQKSGAIFNIEKLNWINREHIKRLSEDQFGQYALSALPENITHLQGYKEETFLKILPILRERIVKFSDVKTMAETGELQYFFEDPKYEAEKIPWKEVSVDETIQHLKQIIEFVSSTKSEQQYNYAINKDIFQYALKAGKGNVLWPMRFALSGREKSPDPFTLALILGKETVLRRLRLAIEKLQASSKDKIFT